MRIRPGSMPSNSSSCRPISVRRARGRVGLLPVLAAEADEAPLLVALRVGQDHRRHPVEVVLAGDVQGAVVEHPVCTPAPFEGALAAVERRR